MLIFAHSMIAGVSHQPHWNLSSEEAANMSQAASNVIRHFNVGATQKGIDIMALAGVCGMVYGPRIMMSVGAKKPEQKERPVAQPIPERQTFTVG